MARREDRCQHGAAATMLQQGRHVQPWLEFDLSRSSYAALKCLRSLLIMTIMTFNSNLSSLPGLYCNSNLSF